MIDFGGKVMEGSIVDFIQIGALVATCVMPLIVLYFNYRMLKLNKKDRERPAMIELLRFCIVPLEEWLDLRKEHSDFQEFNLEELLRSSILIGEYEISVGTSGVSRISRYPLFHPKILYIEFDSLLERRHFKNDWDKKVQEYNKLKHDFDQRKKDLEQELRKFVESPDIKRIYDETEASKNSFEVFKNELVEKFYEQYKSSLRGSELGAPWYFAGKQIFEQCIHRAEPYLKEIEKLMNERNDAINKLISLLEDVRKHIAKEYNVTSSEQIPLIKLPR